MQDPGRFRHLDGRLLSSSATPSPTASPSSSRAEAFSGARARASIAQGLTLVKFFFLCTFAAAVPAIVSGGIAERAQFLPQCVATALIVGLFYPFFEGIVWNKNYGLQEGFFKAKLGEEFHDFAGSIVVHADRRLDRLLRRAPARARGSAATTRGAPSASRRRRSRGSPWAPGCCASAGSAST